MRFAQPRYDWHGDCVSLQVKLERRNTRSSMMGCWEYGGRAFLTGHTLCSFVDDIVRSKHSTARKTRRPGTGSCRDEIGRMLDRFVHAHDENDSDRRCCLDKVITDLTTAIQLAPNDASLYLWRGIAFRARSQLDRAVADFSEALHLEPKGPRAFVERSVAHEQEGEFAMAKADGEQADLLAISLW